MKQARMMWMYALVGVMLSGMGVTARAGATPDGTINIASPESGTGYEWSSATNVVRITANGTYRLTGSTTSPARVAVATGVTATLTLVNCSMSNAVASPLTLESDASSGAKVTLRMEGENRLQCLMSSGKLCPGVQVEDKAELTVGVIGASDGKLTVVGACVDKVDNIENGAAGIGGRVRAKNGKITINSGVLDVQGGYFGSGIGAGGLLTTPGAIVINGGSINVKGGEHGAAIGGGHQGQGGNITINGGTIDATGGGGGAGIGGGYQGHGGNITITGGTITAMGSNAAGIGAGWVGNGGTITISGGVINAVGGYQAACIGGSYGADSREYGNGGTITINGGTITANNSNNVHAAGIGGGLYGDGGTITINDGTITAVGGYQAAGIGGGLVGSAQDIIINGGKIFAKAELAAAIGCGNRVYYSGNVTINGGLIVANATGSNKPAAIGCGSSGVTENVFITGGTVYAASGTGEAIGGRSIGNWGNIRITGGAVIATGIGLRSEYNNVSYPPVVISGENTIVLSQHIVGSDFGNATVLTENKNAEVRYPISLDDTVTDVMLHAPLTIPVNAEIFIPGVYETPPGGGAPQWKSGLKIIGTENLGTGSVIVNYLHKDTVHVNVLDTIHRDSIIYDDTLHLHDTIYLDTTFLHDTIHLDMTYIHDTLHFHDTTYIHDTFYIHIDTLERTDTITTRIVFTIYDTTHVTIARIYDTIPRDTVFIDTTFLIDTIHRDSIILNIFRKDSIDYTLVPDTRIIFIHDTLTQEIFQHDTTYIVIDRTTSTQHTLSNQIRATSYDEGIFLEGLTPGKRFSIFTISGAKYFNGIATNTGTFGLADIADGLYILYQEGKYTKFQHQKP